MTSIARNWAEVQRRAAAAAERAGRAPGEVTVVAASKTFPAEVLREAYGAGVREFGENYVQEALEKLPELPADVCWHLIGHLQSNKARQVAGRFGLIHSVDSVHLARELDKQAAKAGSRQDVLVQVNIADEETKSGLAPDEVLDAVGEVAQLAHLRVRGLMTIGPMVTNAEDARPVFAQLRELRDRAQSRLPDLPLRELSMGMTGDFETAIEEGATLVRVGRAIFGERPAR
jgi:pyridoxal phosphate enzyme (YggS family)